MAKRIKISTKKINKNSDEYKEGYRTAIMHVIAYLSGFFSVFPDIIIPEKIKSDLFDAIQKGWL